MSGSVVPDTHHLPPICRTWKIYLLFSFSFSRHNESCTTFRDIWRDSENFPPLFDSFLIGRRQSKQKGAHNTITTTTTHGQELVAFYGTCEISHIVSPHNHRKWILMDCPGERTDRESSPMHRRMKQNPGRRQQQLPTTYFSSFFFRHGWIWWMLSGIVSLTAIHLIKEQKIPGAWIIKKTCRKWIKLST